MPVNRIVVIVAAILIVLDVIWLLIRGKKNGYASEEVRTRKLITGIISGYAFAIILLVIMLFREFGTVADCVLAGCAVLGIEIENRMLLGITSEWDEDSQ